MKHRGIRDLGVGKNTVNVMGERSGAGMDNDALYGGSQRELTELVAKDGKKGLL
jgi:hypothetical protein